MKASAFLLLFVVACATVERRADYRVLGAEPQNLMVGTEFDAIPAGLIDPSLLIRPTLVLRTYKLGSIDAPLIYPNTEGPYSYFRYTLCSKEVPDKCTTGTHVLGAKIFPTLDAGTYIINTTTCARGKEDKDTCSEASQGEFIKAPNPDKDLTDLVREQVRLTQQIKRMADDIYAAMLRFKDGTFKDTEPSDSFSRLISNQIKLGPIMIGEMINSAQFPNAYKFLYGEELAVEVPSDEKDRKIDALESKVETMSKEIQEIGGLSKTGAFLVFMGTPVFLTGAVLSWVSWRSDLYVKKAENVIDASFNALRKIIYSPLGYRMEMDKARLVEVLKTQGLLQADDTGIELEGKNRLFRTSDGGAYIVETQTDGRTLVYRKGAGLIELPMTIRAASPLSKSAYNQLVSKSPEAVDDFELQKDNYVLRPEAAARYVSFDGSSYRKSWLENVPSFPKLTEATVISLYNNWAEMKRTNPGKADAEWGKGVPLFTEAADGRLILVEPPDAWKAAGKNWFSDPPGWVRTTVTGEVNPDPQFARLYQEGTFPIRFAPTLEYIYQDSGKLYANSPGNIQNFTEQLKQKVSVYTMSDKINPIMGDKWLLGDPAWKIEIALRYQEIMAKKSLASGDLHKIPGQASSVPGWARSGKFVGGFLMMLGVGALIGAVAVEMTLAGSPKETLMKELQTFETGLTDLHRSRAEGVGKVNEWLRRRLLEIPDGWEYHL